MAHPHATVERKPPLIVPSRRRRGRLQGGEKGGAELSTVVDNTARLAPTLPMGPVLVVSSGICTLVVVIVALLLAIALALLLLTLLVLLSALILAFVLAFLSAVLLVFSSAFLSAVILVFLLAVLLTFLLTILSEAFFAVVVARAGSVTSQCGR